MGQLLIRYTDYGKPQQGSSVKYPFPDLTAVNFASVTGHMDDLVAATNNIVLGVPDRVRWQVSLHEELPTLPVSPQAQREIKWFVRYHNAAGDLGRLFIPTADLTKLDPNTRGRADLTNPDVAAFVAAFEDLVTLNGGAVTVDELIHVGANL